MENSIVQKYLAFYTKKASPPESALKPIIGGNLKGKTDINPQWRIDALTELYGLCGFGWYYKVTSRHEKTYTDKVDIFVSIDLFVKIDGEWSQPIHGEGGNWYAKMAGERDSKYPTTNDEVYKMCISDAISVAAKQLGIGGDIYAGSKYISINEYGDLERINNKPLSKKEIEENKATEAKKAEEVAKANEVAAAKKLDLISEALQEIQKTPTLADLAKVWTKYNTVQSVQAVLDAKNKRKEELTINNK